MTDEEYIRALALFLTREEDLTFAESRSALLELVLRLRALLLTLPDSPLARRLAYSRLRPQLTTTIQTTSNTIFTTLLTHLPTVERTTLRTAADHLAASTPPLPRPIPEILRTTRIGVESLITLFTPVPATNISPFTLQLLRLLDRSIESRFFTNTPTAQILTELFPTRNRPRFAPIPTKGTILSSFQSRIRSIIAAIYWSVAYTSQQRAATTSPRRITAWRWNAILDPKTCPICRPLHNQTRPTPDQFPQGPPPVHPSCVLGNTQVTTGTIVAATRATYSGNVVTIRTESGSNISVTSQHPVLTDIGWVRAEDLRNGINLLRHSQRFPSGFDTPDFNYGPPTAEQVFKAFRSTPGVSTGSVPASPVQFHGDGISLQGEVEVVWADWILKEVPDAQLGQHLPKLDGVVANAELTLKASLGSTDALFLGMNASASGLVGLSEQCLALLNGHLSLSEKHRLTAVALSNPALAEPFYDNVPGTTEHISKFLDACPGLVALDKIIDINVQPAGHGLSVYDFTTLSGLYAAGGQLVHNCRCILLPIYTD